jgi:3-deoxy-7-phosphoheptulonate synthase
VKTTGNADGHVVLRGGRDGTNYGADAIARAVAAIEADPTARPIMVDTSHDNSGKDHTRQAEVCREVLRTFEAGQSSLCGLLIESNLGAGKQTWKPDVELRYGVSITDACIGWDETEPLIDEIAESVRRARGLRAGSQAKSARSRS